jgi:hypothetical protein
MKKFALVVVLLAGTLMVGCAPTLTESAPERSRRIALQSDIQMKMLVEDWDCFWLMDKNSTLSQWHPYVGY